MITSAVLNFVRRLAAEDRSQGTIEKYARDVRAFTEQLELLMETICATGIRVSEVKYITMEAAARGRRRSI